MKLKVNLRKREKGERGREEVELPRRSAEDKTKSMFLT